MTDSAQTTDLHGFLIPEQKRLDVRLTRMDDRNRPVENSLNRIALLATVSLLAVCSAAAAENPTSDTLAGLEKKLHGNWRGGPAPCVGKLLFKADGTYERRHFSPANINSGGTWSLCWDALPPTLTLNCKTSDDPDDVNKAFQYKLSRLDDATFAIKHENGLKALVYGRDKKSK